jgi:hypothetical protein
LQMCKFGSLNFFHNTSSNIHKQQGMFFFSFFRSFFELLFTFFYAISSLWTAFPLFL